MGLFGTHTSCQHFQRNQLSMLLAALGYVLMERLRSFALQGTELAAPQVDTLCIKLLIVAAVITRNTLTPRVAPSLRDTTIIARIPSQVGVGGSSGRNFEK